ncbi:MAG TPA: archease [Bacillota bacterium]
MTSEAGWEITEHTADVGIRAWGPSAADALSRAALGMLALVVPAERVRPIRRWAVEVSAPDPDLLLFNLLDELLYRHHVEGLLAHDVAAEVAAAGGPGGAAGGWVARAAVRGEPVDTARHRPGPEIKAVTLHGISLRPEGGQWVARVVVDL